MTPTTFRKYLELTKPKVTLLNLLVALTCFFLAAYPAIDWKMFAVFAIIGYLAAGGCGVLNSVYDKDIDRLMTRTSKRAIPSGKIPVKKASTFGIAMIAVSIGASAYFLNLLTALMMGLGAIFYLVIYTVWLKRTSPWNVVIGGFAGCFAALSGWTAVANSISLTPLFIAMLDFLWTPGHLWGLAIKKIRDYTIAGVPMLPVKIGVNRCAKVVFLINISTVAFSLSFVFFNLAGATYTVVASVAGAGFLLQNKGLLGVQQQVYGFKVFIASMPYLMCLVLALMLDKIWLV